MMGKETVDLVEVVRCRDCKYNSAKRDAGNASCAKFYEMTNQNGFCCYGQRKPNVT